VGKKQPQRVAGQVEMKGRVEHGAEERQKVFQPGRRRGGGQRVIQEQTGAVVRGGPGGRGLTLPRKQKGR
jgi:hypothetical protein